MTTKTKKQIEVTEGYQFDKENHVHTLDGKTLFGVTTVLGVIAKPMLIQWAANETEKYIREHVAYAIPGEDGGYWAIKPSDVEAAKTAHRKKKEEAGTKGTDIHAECELYIKACIEQHKGLSFKPEAKMNPQVENFINWAIENKVKFLASEKQIYSERMWVGGIADIICEIEGKRFVGDIKTSSGIYPEHFIQASAYAQMLKEMGLTGEKTPFDGVVIINLKKDGGFDVKFNYDLEGNLACFEAALTLHKHLKAIK